MNYEILKKVLIKSKIKIAIVGLMTTLLGLLMLFLTLSSESKVVYWIFLSVFLIIGLFMIISSILNLTEIKSEKYPLLRAIKDKQTDFMVWVYEQQIKSKVEGVTVSKNSNINIYDKNGKMYALLLNKRTLSVDVINYLKTEFPNIYIGYDKETRETVSKILNKKL